MKKFHYLDTIISPNITEKSTSLSEFNKVVFKVNVIKINTINLKPKTKIIKNKKVFKPGAKKAIVTLKKGQSIDLSTGI